MPVETLDDYLELFQTGVATMAGGWGGRRAGAGRKHGSHSLVTMQERVKTATEYLRTNNARIFDGDSIALMMSVYKNEDMPLNLRLQCAMAVAPFERPRLVATASVHKTVNEDDEAFGRLFQQIEQRLALQPPERRAEVIDMLAEGEPSQNSGAAGDIER